MACSDFAQHPTFFIDKLHRVSKKNLWLVLLLVPALFGHDSPAPAAGSAPADWATKTIQLKYLDPEDLRSVFSGRSYVMQVNRELKLLTVSGPTEFLNEVEQTGKRLDIPPPLPANIEVTVYLLTATSQTATALPAELEGIRKKFSSLPSAKSFQLIDCQTLRVREGEAGDISFGEPGSSGIGLAHISVQSALLSSGEKSGRISLVGLRCWLSKSSGQASSSPDITANIDVVQNQVALVAETGFDKPVAVVVRASVSQ